MIGVLVCNTEKINIRCQLFRPTMRNVNTGRTTTLTKIQGYADKCKDDYFISYLNGFDQASTSMEKCDPIIYFYRSAFDRVMDGIKNLKVENGTAAIWLLYNMGYVVKTPSGCFAIDISHRWAKELALYIVFLCVTHKHSDHYSNDLIHAMFDLGTSGIDNQRRRTPQLLCSGIYFLCQLRKNSFMTSFGTVVVIIITSNKTYCQKTKQ